MTPTMERVSVNGAELEVAVQGSGETIVFIHGAGFADSYLPLAIDPAVRDHYRTVRYRRRGFGGSSPLDGPMAVAAHASDCRALLAALDVAKAHVVGHSYGGAVALQLAVDAPDVVATIAAFEPALLAVPSGPRFFEDVGPIFEMYNSGDRVGAVHAFSRPCAVRTGEAMSREPSRAASNRPRTMRRRCSSRICLRWGLGSSGLKKRRRSISRCSTCSDPTACRYSAREETF
jgi:pimeloyl-ACP methyl ester carboxylesterase